MDNKTLFLFMKKILSGTSQDKARQSLGQLKQIYVAQGDERTGKLIQDAINSLPESQQVAKGTVFTQQELNIAVRRAEARRAREAAARQYGRC